MPPKDTRLKKKKDNEFFFRDIEVFSLKNGIQDIDSFRPIQLETIYIKLKVVI
jgi:hypothetical protein